MSEWKSGFGGARWLCGLGLHPSPPKKSKDNRCPACGKEVLGETKMSDMRKQKLPADMNKKAKAVVDLATEKADVTQKVTPVASDSDDPKNVGSKPE